MAQLGEILGWSLRAWLAFLGVMLIWKMVRGTILLNGLFSPTRKAHAGLDRMQLAVVTILFAFFYAMLALSADANAGSLPRIPTPLLLVLTGSNAAYLSVKYARRNRSRAEGRHAN